MNNQPTSKNEFGEITEQFLSANKTDEKGREIGYVVGLRDNGVDFYAWVQCARRTGLCEWLDFGVRQRSRRFDSQQAATRWAFATARERLAKIAA